MKKIWQKAAALFVCAILVTAAAAAGGSGETKSGDSTVKIWISAGAEDNIYRDMFRQISADTGISIKDEYYPKDELNNKLQLAPVVGDAPDVIVLDGLDVAYYYDVGMIENIDSRVSPDLRRDLMQSVIDESTYDGKLHAVAQFDSGMAMWANKSMLQKAGVRIPVSYKEAWNKAEFEDALAKLKASGVKFPLYIRQNNPSSLYFTYLPVVRSFGGDFLNRNTMLAEGTLNGQNTVAAYRYMAWLGDQGYMNPLCDYEDGFYGRKESALSLVGHWKYTDHVNGLGDDAILVPIPDFGHGVFTGSGSVVWVMSTSATENGKADASWKVMEAALQPKYINMVTDFNGAIPSRLSILNSKDEFKPGARLYLYREQLEAGISYLRPLTPAHMTIWSAVRDATTDILVGEDAQKALDDAARSTDAIIKENGWNK
ncbi:sugar ABC transporter substrate-binding protein [Breznakiella homolactica]|uniref:Extracellular solute-binding protein n=1 Tax=Breznakiella homolactica TaxID=2798577 RepID=A0A7T8B930_9SPIR|nr:extracellular solute-binding protein [Breznakiella homolactica]QQO07520.1 extracellular solute-binding protein [Breznakiella homolactica]